MLDPRVVELASGKNFGVLTTLLSDGTPQTHVMWVDCDAEHLLLNTEAHRTKFRNVMRDPRVTVLIWDAADPYRYVEVRGTVVETVRGSAARDHIDALSEKYLGELYPNPIQSERVMLRVAPQRQITRD